MMSKRITIRIDDKIYDNLLEKALIMGDNISDYIRKILILYSISISEIDKENDRFQKMIDYNNSKIKELKKQEVMLSSKKQQPENNPLNQVAKDIFKVLANSDKTEHENIIEKSVKKYDLPEKEIIISQIKKYIRHI